MNASFDGIAESYRHAMKELEPLYAQVATLVASHVRGAVVLDVGAGGRFAYDLSLPSRVIALDESAAMLANIHDPRVEAIVGDATSMTSIPDGSVDVVMFCLVLHHVTGATLAQTLQRLSDTLDTASRKLRPGGHIAIVEVLVPPWLYPFEAMTFGLVRNVLARRSRDMIFLYRRRDIVRRLTALFANPIAIHRLKRPAWYDPLAGSFPGRIRIPSFLSPTPFELYVVRK